MTKGITFSIQPDVADVSVSLFQKSLDRVVRLVLDVDYALHRERNPRRWVVARLHSSMPTVTLAPKLDDPRLVDLIVQGVSVVVSGEAQHPPEYFTEEALAGLREMRALFKGKDKAKALLLATDGNRVAIDGRIEQQVSKILASGYWNLGSIEGSLDAINLHGKPAVTVWDRVTGAPVKCWLPPGPLWEDRARKLLKQRVLVSGRVNYFMNGVPRSVAEVREIVDSAATPDLPKAEFGSIPDAEAAADPVRFLRRARMGS